MAVIPCNTTHHNILCTHVLSPYDFPFAVGLPSLELSGQDTLHVLKENIERRRCGISEGRHNSILEDIAMIQILQS